MFIEPHERHFENFGIVFETEFFLETIQSHHRLVFGDILASLRHLVSFLSHEPNQASSDNASKPTKKSNSAGFSFPWLPYWNIGF
jgi:hypothetical protein